MERVNFGIFDHIERTTSDGPLQQLLE